MKVKAPLGDSLSKFIGRTVLIDGNPVVIKKIVGNIEKPQFFEINDEHLIGMLRFFAQMENDKSIKEETIRAFEEMDFHVERAPANKTKSAIEL
jgi:hypothetical protein